MSEPQTEAGRALLAHFEMWFEDDPDYGTDIARRGSAAAAAERARLAGLVGQLPAYENDEGDPDTYVYDPSAVYREAVLRLLSGGAS